MSDKKPEEHRDDSLEDQLERLKQIHDSRVLAERENMKEDGEDMAKKKKKKQPKQNHAPKVEKVEAPATETSPPEEPIEEAVAEVAPEETEAPSEMNLNVTIDETSPEEDSPADEPEEQLVEPTYPDEEKQPQEEESVHEESAHPRHPVYLPEDVPENPNEPLDRDAPKEEKQETVTKATTAATPEEPVTDYASLLQEALAENEKFRELLEKDKAFMDKQMSLIDELEQALTETKKMLDGTHVHNQEQKEVIHQLKQENAVLREAFFNGVRPKLLELAQLFKDPAILSLFPSE